MLSLTQNTWKEAKTWKSTCLIWLLPVHSYIFGMIRPALEVHATHAKQLINLKTLGPHQNILPIFCRPHFLMHYQVRYRNTELHYKDKTVVKLHYLYDWNSCAVKIAASYLISPLRSPWVNSLSPNDAIWRHRSGSTLAQVIACCLTAPSHYLNQCWDIISKV